MQEMLTIFEWPCGCNLKVAMRDTFLFHACKKHVTWIPEPVEVKRKDRGIEMYGGIINSEKVGFFLRERIIDFNPQSPL
jgi:hypothetical protein